MENGIICIALKWDIASSSIGPQITLHGSTDLSSLRREKNFPQKPLSGQRFWKTLPPT
jgi:hypothetical protein